MFEYIAIYIVPFGRFLAISIDEMLYALIGVYNGMIGRVKGKRNMYVHLYK
jgi:hypothetical protein